MANSHQPYREDSYLKLKIGTTTIKGIFLLSEPVSVVPISLSLSLSLSLSFKPFNRKEQLSFVIILSVLSLTLYFHILTESIFYQVNFTSQDALNQHSLVLSNYLLFLKNGLFRLFLVFQSSNTIFTTNQCEKMSCPPSIRHLDSNP